MFGEFHQQGVGAGLAGFARRLPLRPYTCWPQVPGLTLIGEHDMQDFLYAMRKSGCLNRDGRFNTM